MNIRHSIIAVATLLVIPTGAAAQVSAEASASAEVQVQGEQRSAERSGSASAEAVVRATVEAGLPERPVRRTVAEGRAKGASEAEVVRAALGTHARLATAREAVEEEERTASADEITLAAEALAAGASRDDLRRIRDAAPADRPLEGAFHALVGAQLEGAASAEAAARIASQLAQGANDGALASAALGSAAGSAARGAIGAGAGVVGSVGAGIIP